MFFVHGVVLFEMKGSGTVWHSNPVTKDDAAGDGFGSILAIPWFGQVIQHVELSLLSQTHTFIGALHGFFRVFQMPPGIVSLIASGRQQV